MTRPQQSTMHRCLLISEIVDEICEILYCNYQFKALSRISQTCKTLHEAVAPTLWKDIVGLIPLLRLLPQDTWTETQNPDGRGTTFHITNPDAIDWTRYQYYAPFVRSFSWSSYENFSTETLAAVALHSPYGNALLPRLSELTWDDFRPPCIAFAHIFLTSSIRKLDLFVHERCQPVATAALFEHAAHACKEVEVLKLNSDCCASDFYAEFLPTVDIALAKWLRVLTNLRRVRGGHYFSARCVEALATLPHLEKVRLYINSEQMDAAASALVPLSAAGTCFNSILDLELDIFQLSWGSDAFLRTVRSPNLHRLQLTIDCSADSFIVQKHMQACASAAYKVSLRHISFSMSSDDSAHPPPALSVKTIISPLLALQQLEAVYVALPILEVDGATLRAMTEAWPALKALVIWDLSRSDRTRPSKYDLTLRDLVHVARNCPGLRTLDLSLDATDVPADDDPVVQQFLSDPSHCRLKYLSMCRAPIGDPNAVARFLIRLFPELEVTFDSNPCRWPNDWEEVKELLREERARTGLTRQTLAAVCTNVSS
ncbi:hypothetical protein C8Q73DRAFT_822155 [Cubamyces lactineus]|nr:hypothetical protein C8Q73DRAFT_822155 [Cubamyces lactineus]